MAVEEFMPELELLLKEVREKVALGKPFPFYESLNRLEEIIPKEPQKKPFNFDNVSVDGLLILGKGSEVKPFTRIEGTVVIGENTKVGPFAYLRNGTVIGDNCRVGRSEVKNSIILDKSYVSHFSYVGDSLIGENVNFGAGAKVANLRFDDKHVNVLLNGEKVDSGRRKLGTLILSGTKIGINTSINCGAIVFPKSVIPPHALVKGVFPEK